MGGRRGRFISFSNRRIACTLVEEAHRSGARKAMACKELGISLRSLQRWIEEGAVTEDQRKKAVRSRPSHALSPEEEQEVLEITRDPEFADLPPSQIVPTLADRGKYIASESTFYRILRKHSQQQHRGRSIQRVARIPTTHEATGPNEVWSWDISWLPGPVKGMYYYLYLILDIYSRFIVGWEIWERESEEHAAELVTRAVLAQKIGTAPLVLHSDNGSPMKGSTFLETCRTLGIVPSRSRPRVSNDNAYSESLFRTYKYRPVFPSKGFESLETSRLWTRDFVEWYNEKHHHSAIGFVTPGQRHRGEHTEILEIRKKVYEEAKSSNPKRWSRNTRIWENPQSVFLNPEKVSTKEEPREDLQETCAL